MNEKEKQHYHTLLGSGDIRAADEFAADCGEMDSLAIADIAKVFRDVAPLSEHAALQQIHAIIKERAE